MRITLKEGLRIRWGTQYRVFQIGIPQEVPEDLCEYIKKNYPQKIENVEQQPKIPIEKPKEVKQVEQVQEIKQVNLFEVFFEKKVFEIDPILKKGLELGVIKKVSDGFEFEGKKVETLKILDPKDVEKTLEIISV